MLWRILLVFGISALSILEGTASDTDSKETDREPQLSLNLAVQDPNSLRDLTEKLELQIPFDFAAAEKDGTLSNKVKSLKPLQRSDWIASSDGARLSPKAYIATATIWRPGDPGAVRSYSGQYRIEISVCWLNPTVENEHGRMLTEEAVKATWQYHSVVMFTGWRKCSPTSKGIRIKVSSERPWSQYGNLSANESQSMSLDFLFDDEEMQACQQKSDLCIWSIAVHEFGHALGFIHEQDSNETPNWCKKRLSPGDIVTPEAKLKAKMITAWDRFSVMDYCFDIYSHRVQLSDCDVAALHGLYTRPANPPYTPSCELRKNGPGQN